MGKLRDNCKNVVFAHDKVVNAVELYFCARILAEQHSVACFYCHGDELAVVSCFAGADSNNLAFRGLFFRRIGDEKAAGCVVFALKALYKHAIEGFNGAKGMMPPKGGNAALGDDEIKLIVDFMVGQAQ